MNHTSLKFCVQYQTYSKEHIEWIILDDGKEDRSELFDLEFANYVKIFKQLNIGRKRQIVRDIACGEFKIFFDDDDIHFSHRIENLKVTKSWITLIVEIQRCLFKTFDENIYEVGHFTKIIVPQGQCFRKEIFKGTSFRESDQAGEEAFFFKN